MRSKRNWDRCIDKKARSDWLLEMFSNTARGEEVSLSDKSKRHLTLCDHCAENFPAAVEREKARPEIIKVGEMVGRAQLGDETILRRVFKNGIALWEPVEGERTGRFAFVDSKGQALVQDRLTLDQFEDWRPFEELNSGELK